MEVTESLNASTILMYLFILHKLSNVEGNEVCITDTEMVKSFRLKDLPFQIQEEYSRKMN
jgi:hypothetical protein